MGASAEVLAYVQALAWPDVAMGGFLIFRKSISNLIPRISQISAAGASVTFWEKAEELADTAGALAEDAIEKSPVSPTLPPLPPVADPTMTFLEAYRELVLQQHFVIPEAAGVMRFTGVGLPAASPA
jgi:hypothetical protein